MNVKDQAYNREAGNGAEFLSLADEVDQAIKGGKTQPILSEDLWARAASSRTSWWRCSETATDWRRIVAYGRSKRMQQSGHGWFSLNLSAVCGRLHLNLEVPDA